MRAYYFDTDEFHEYVYDALGRGIEKTVDGVTTRYLYAQDRVVEERDGATGDVLASYVYGRYVDEVLSMRRDTDAVFEDYFHLVVHQFNVIRVTDAAGAIVESCRYGAVWINALLVGDGFTLVCCRCRRAYFICLHQ